MGVVEPDGLAGGLGYLSVDTYASLRSPEVIETHVLDPGETISGLTRGFLFVFGCWFC